MKATYIQFCFLFFTLWLFSACVADEFPPRQEEGESDNIRLHLTTPSLSQVAIDPEAYYPETRGTHTAAQAIVTGDRIDTEQVYLLFFNNSTAPLKTFVKMTASESDKHYIGKVPNYKDIYLRVVANVSIDEAWIGKTWEELQENLFEVAQTYSSTTAYPLYAEIGVKDLSTENTLGTSAAPIPLLRSVAKLTVEVNEAAEDVVFSGFRTFSVRETGYSFPRGEAKDNATADTFDEEVSAYTNGRTTIFLPETFLENEGIEQTYVVIKASYKGVEGYYRVDLRNEEGELIDLRRNYEYMIRLDDNLSYGYSDETGAIADPVNDEGKRVIIEENEAYDFIYNDNENYMGFLNSSVVIYGKKAYYENNFSGTIKPYWYVLTEIESDHADEIEVLDDGGLGMDNIKIERAESGVYILATMQNAQKGNNNVKLRYKNMVRTIPVYWMDEYIDCTYGRLPLTTDGSTPLRSTLAEVVDQQQSRTWIGLSTADENAASGGGLTPRLNQYGTAAYVQFRENLAVNGDKEGFRFSEVFASGTNSKGTVKYIFAQAGADLSGYFGSSQLVAYSELNNDDGTKYDSYLVSERITDEIYTLGSSLAEYCKNKNPKGETIWYLPSHRQLIGLWLTNNSNSRKTSPMNVAPAATPTFRYISRSTYTQAHSNYYETAKTFSDGLHNPDNGPLNVPSRYPIINFSDGNSSRVAQSGLSNVIRCVRNLPNSNSTTSPVSGRTVTIDPAGRLSNDYFNQTDWNPIARKIAVVEPPEPSDKTIVYKWTSTAGSGYTYDRTTGLVLKKHYFSWKKLPGWQRNGVDRYEKHKGESYTVENYNSNPPPADNKEIGIPEKLIAHEITLTEAYEGRGSHRLPTARELHMLYIYEPLFNSSGVTSFYKDEADGYYESLPSSNPSTATSVVPNRLLYAMRLYPLGDTAYMHWYWSSTIEGENNDSGSFSGNDSGIIPHRMNFHFGDMNRRGSGEPGAEDHVRYVDTVE